MNPPDPIPASAVPAAPAVPDNPLEHLRRESPREARIDYAVAVGLALVASVSEWMFPFDPSKWTLWFMLWTPLLAWSAAAWMVVGRTNLVWTCARQSFREEMHLANLRPFECLEARLRGALRRLFPCILIPAIPGLVVRVLALWKFSESAGASDRSQQVTMIMTGVETIQMYGLGPMVIAMIARSAFYELAIQARTPGSTPGLVAARGVVTMVLRQFPATVGVWFASLSLVVAVSSLADLLATKLVPQPYRRDFLNPPDDFSLPALGIFGSFVLLSGLVGGGMRLYFAHRRDYARQRMDALE